jgi:hypothetical protein
MNVYVGVVLELHIFLTLATDGGEWLYPGENTTAVGWVTVPVWTL